MKKIYLVLLFPVLCLLFAPLYGQEKSYELLLKSGTFVPEENTEAFIADPIVDEEEIYSGQYFRIIQFSQIPSNEEKKELSYAGIRLLNYLPRLAFFASVSTDADISILRHLNCRSILPVLPAYKLSAALSAQEYPDWALRAGDQISLTLQYFEGLDHEDILASLEKEGGEITGSYDYSRLVHITLPIAEIPAMARLPFISGIAAEDPPAEPENYRARTSHRSNMVAADFSAGRQYDGEGVIVAMGDDGIIGPHIDYEGRVDQSNVSSNNGDHGDHVAGTIFGAGNLDPLGRGMAFGADLHVYSVWDAVNSTPTSYTSPGVRITSTSYSNGCNSYTSFSETVDLQTYQMASLIHVFSAGNNGTADCGYGAGSGWGNITGGVKMGKNVLAVGNLSFTDGLANSSSRGPANDGRVKPEVCAVGSSVYSTIDANSYDIKSGTSMACPGVSGTIAQLYQAHRELYGLDPESGLIKGILMNTGDDLGNPGPDYKFGYGRINALRAVEALEEGNFLIDSVSQGVTNTHNIAVPAGTDQLRIMVYWMDYPGDPTAAIALVNDLNMEVTDPGAVVYNPWVLDPTPNATNLDAPATRKVDDLNNAEQVTIGGPAAGNYTVTIDGFSVPQGPQKYFITYSFVSDTVNLVYPNGGEGFVPGETEVLRWDAYGNSGNFQLEYSLDSGITWNLISSSVNDALRHYQWTVPATVTGQAFVRVSRGTSSAVNTEPFSIIGVPENIAVDWSCPDSIQLSWDPVSGATAYEVSMLGIKYMDSLATSPVNEAVIYGISPLNEHWFSVKSLGPDDAVGRRAMAVKKAAGTWNCVIPLDANLAQVINPVQGTLFNCVDNSALDVIVKIKNTGTDTLSNVPVNYEINNGPVTAETFTGSIPPGDSAVHTFSSTVDYSATGTYTLTTWVEYPSDGNAFNDTLRNVSDVVSGTVLSLPWSENFETFSTCSGSSGCEAINCNLSNGWHNEPNTQFDDIDWRINSGGTPSAGTGPAMDHDLGTSSGKYLYTEASPCYNKTAEVISPCINLSSAVYPKLTFWYHMDGADMGNLHVDVLADGVWQEDIITPITGEQGNAWLEAIMDMTAFNGKIINVRFRGMTGPDYLSDMAIDAVSVTENSTPPVAGFSADLLVGCPGSVITFTDESVNIPTAWSWSFSPSNVTYVNGTSSSSQHPEVTFSAAGSYEVQLIASNPFGSNTHIKTAYIEILDGELLPLTEDFEGSGFPPPYWKIENPDGDVSWSKQIMVPGSDGQSTSTAFVNNYNYDAPGEEDHLLSLPVYIGNVIAPELTFDVAYVGYSAAFTDTLRVEVSTDCGETFQQVYFKGGADLATSANQTTLWYPGNASHWRNDTVDLVPWAGDDLILRFTNINGYGNSLFIDNININGTPGFWHSDNYCVDSLIQFQDTMASFSSYSWDFGTDAVPAIGTGAGPHNVTYTGPGAKTITMSGVSGTDTTVFQTFLVIDELPLADFSWAESGTETDIQFSDNSSNATAWSWEFGDGNTVTNISSPFHSYTDTGTYQVIQVVSNNCASDSVMQEITITILSISGIKDKSAMSIFPNPSGGTLHISIPDINSKTVRLTITDSRGSELLVENFKAVHQDFEHHLDLSSYAKGIYFLQITTDKDRYVSKVGLR